MVVRAVPEPYNACVDLVDRHVEAGRGDRIAVVGEPDPTGGKASSQSALEMT